MDMIEAYRTCIKKYATFQGRARRSEYWLFTLCNSMISLFLSGVSYFAQSRQSQNLVMGIAVISVIYSLFILLPGLAVTVRRLHDTGHSGWFFFIAFIPIVGSIILIVSLCKDSVPGDNEYGPNPKEPDSGFSFLPGLDGAAVPPVSERRHAVIDEESNHETVRVYDRSYETVSIKPVLKVECTRGPIVGKFAVGEVIYIGRDPQLCQLVFPHDTPGVSNVHCMVHTDGKTIEIRDLGSSFGTFFADKTRLNPNETYYLTDGNTTQANKPSANMIYIGSENVTISVNISSPLHM